MKEPRAQGGAPRHAGIIAAGLGTRLAKSHPGLVKPLVPVAGRPLCHWVVASLRQAGVREITLLHNSAGREIRRSLETAFPEVGWTFHEEDTASSWESFRLVSRSLAERAEGFLMSTVDAIVPPADMEKFGRFASSCGAQAGLALTKFIDDEKPLYADIDEDGYIEALGDSCRRRQHVTAGLYYMTAHATARMPSASSHPSLRSFLGGLFDAGVPIAGYTLSKTLDVDRPADVETAEQFLSEAMATW